MNVSPEDFSSDTPPPRIIGVECEYNLQLPVPRAYEHPVFLDEKEMRKKGFPNRNSYLGARVGSGRVYPDVGHLEFATAEAIGPASAAVEDIRGIQHLSDIVCARGYDHNGLYRLAGTSVPKKGKLGDIDYSSGYHENYIFPRSLVDHHLVYTLIPAMLATRVWAMGGTLLPGGFALSQKVSGIGGEPVRQSLDLLRRTQGAKPMVTIPDKAKDHGTIGIDHWSRVEVRFADPNGSPLISFLSFAAVSLTLRLIEHAHLFRWGQLESVALKDPVEAAQQITGDLSLQKTVELESGKMLSGLDMQETLLDCFDELMKRGVQLPDDERLAITAIRGIVDALRKSNPKEADYTNVAKARVAFAAKHEFVSSGQPLETITSYNAEALERSLLWDRVLPRGYGAKYWDAMADRDPLSGHVRAFAARAGLAGRAYRRAEMIDNPDLGYEVLNWAKYKIRRVNEIKTFKSIYGA